jgi:hypothetical protein
VSIPLIDKKIVTLDPVDPREAIESLAKLSCGQKQLFMIQNQSWERKKEKVSIQGNSASFYVI